MVQGATGLVTGRNGAGSAGPWAHLRDLGLAGRTQSANGHASHHWVQGSLPIAR